MAAFYLDEDAPETLAAFLVAAGHAAATTRAEGCKGAADYDQLWHAALRGWILVTLNRSEDTMDHVRNVVDGEALGCQPFVAIGRERVEPLSPFQDLHLPHGNPEERAPVALGKDLDEVIETGQVFFQDRKADGY